jgi:16S rRNA (cytidine1402-2'-O)-methyltransferase
LAQLAEAFGEDRQACVSREISKLHEENVRGTLVELIDYYENNPLKGEIVLTVEGKAEKKESREDKRKAKYGKEE